MSDCVNCEASVPDDARFCPACGCKVERAANAPLECRSCHAALAPDARFCTECGTAADNVQPVAAPAAEEDSAPPAAPSAARPALLYGRAPAASRRESAEHDAVRAAPPGEPEIEPRPGERASARRESTRMLPTIAAAAVIVGAAAFIFGLGAGDDAPQRTERPAGTLVQESPQIPPAPPAPSSRNDATAARPIAPPPVIADRKRLGDEPPPVKAPVKAEKQDAAVAADAAPLHASAKPAEAQRPPRGNRQLARRLNARGLALSREGRHAEAASQFRAARDADRGDPEITENLGYSLLKAGRLAEAESALLAAVEIAPKRATAWGSLGFVQAKRGRHGEGVKLMREALRVAPDPQQTLATYSRQARTESDPRVRAMLAEVVSRAPDTR